MNACVAIGAATPKEGAVVAEARDLWITLAFSTRLLILSYMHPRHFFSN